MYKRKLLSLVALTFFSVSCAKNSPDAFEKQMDSYLSNDNNVVKVTNSIERYYRKKQEDQQQKTVQAEKDQFENQFKNPTVIDIGSSPVRGDKDAKVTIVTFSDFQCPFCTRGAAVMDEVLKAYPKDVKIVFKNMPLPFHNMAKSAATAALAAAKQGKFWEMHDALFQNQNQLSEKLYLDVAKKEKLNLDKFKADLKDPALASIIEQDMELASKVGVRGTPGFFVNGVSVSGAQPLEKFKSIIDRWLSQK